MAIAEGAPAQGHHLGTDLGWAVVRLGRFFEVIALRYGAGEYLHISRQVCDKLVQSLSNSTICIKKFDNNELSQTCRKTRNLGAGLESNKNQLTKTGIFCKR